jgi:hypothetical protein
MMGPFLAKACDIDFSSGKRIARVTSKCGGAALEVEGHCVWFGSEPKFSHLVFQFLNRSRIASYATAKRFGLQRKFTADHPLDSHLLMLSAR